MSAARPAAGHPVTARGALRQAACALALVLGAWAPAAQADVDWYALWDYGRPEVSEQRFRDALATATGDDALILRTQLARTYSLRGRFEDARRELDVVAPLLERAGPEPRVHALLEQGRVARSSGRPVEARPLFEQAVTLAQQAKLEFLTADAMHMVALVEPTLEGQLAWNRRVIEVARAASDPRAQRWEGPALNNIGVSLNEAGRHLEALEALRGALAVAERRGRPELTRVPRWMVAHTLRLLDRRDEALAMQQSLERELDAAGQPDAYVYRELALLYEAGGDTARAAAARERLRVLGEPR